MGTLAGFPNPPALWLRRAKPGCAYVEMGTQAGFPNPPALSLRRAKPGCAYAVDGNPGRVSCALGTCHPPYLPLAALGLAKPSRALAEVRRDAAEGREGQDGLGVVPSADEVGRQSPAAPTRLMGTLAGLAAHSAPATRPTSPSLRSASPNPPALWLRRALLGCAYAVDGNPGRVSCALGTCHPPCHPLATLGLAKPSRDGPQASRPSAKRAGSPSL